jgi:hypothetical protein
MNWMKRKRHPTEEPDPLALCALCHREIGDEAERFVRGAKLRPQARQLLEGHMGTLVSMDLVSTGGTFYAIVPTPDSPAVAKGYDILFQACSQACADALDALLKEELKLGGQPDKPPAAGG